jgi:excisionase family DNA binding protein
VNFKLELPEGTILINKTDLKMAVEELIKDVMEENANEDEIMTIRDAAQFLKVSIPTIRSLISKGEIPFFKRGQIIRLNRLDLKEWLKENHGQ